MLVKNTDTELLPITPDKINDPTAKELALQNSGVTRRKTYDVMYEGLGATREFRNIAENGEEIVEVVPDHLVRHKYMETALKVFGDLKDKQEIEMSHKMENSDRELLMKYGVIKGGEKNVSDD